MNPTIDRLKILFLGVFVFATAVIMIWQVGWVQPMNRCEAAHRWWDHSQRVCAQPILIFDITGRVITDPQARAQALKAIGRDPAAATPAPKP